MNISSIIIKARDIDDTSRRLDKIDGVEVHLKEDVTIIAVIEAENIEKEIATLKLIESTPGVISATMHYSYFEDELRDEINNINKQMPEILNNDNTPVESIQYYGNIYKK